MYHGVGDHPAARGELRYTVAEAGLRRHAEVLATEAHVLGLDALLRGDGGPSSVVLTFDDGEHTVHTLGLPVLRDAGLVATIYVTTGWIGTAGYLDADQLRDLRDAGWTIGAHGVTHRYLSDLSDAELEREVYEPRETLERILGEAPRHMSLPGGRADRRVVRAVRQAGYASLGLSVIGRCAHPPRDPLALPRVMVLRGHDHAHIRRLATGDRRLLLKMRARQDALDRVKSLLGNSTYDALRGRALDLLGRR